MQSLKPPMELFLEISWDFHPCFYQLGSTHLGAKTEVYILICGRVRIFLDREGGAGNRMEEVRVRLYRLMIID